MLSSPSQPRSNTLIINHKSSSSFSTRNPCPEWSFTRTDKALFGGVLTTVRVEYPERNQIKNVCTVHHFCRDGNSIQKWKLWPSWNCYFYTQKRKKNAPPPKKKRKKFHEELIRRKENHPDIEKQLVKIVPIRKNDIKLTAVRLYSI